MKNCNKIFLNLFSILIILFNLTSCVGTNNLTLDELNNATLTSDPSIKFVNLDVPLTC